MSAERPRDDDGRSGVGEQSAGGEQPVTGEGADVGRRLGPLAGDRSLPVSRRSLLGGVLALVAAVLFAGKVRLERVRARLVDDLHGATDGGPVGTYTGDDLAGLPAPVGRYFETVLTEGQPHVRAARLEQRGEFRLGDAEDPWYPLRATQDYTVDPPGFVWDAEIRMGGVLPVQVVDAYTGGEGLLRATLLWTLPVAESEPSPELNEGELTRYLSEAVWFPTALLPAAGVEWEPVDDRSARATLTHAGTTASVVFHFDEDDRIERVTTDRPREVDGGFESTPWTGYFRDYEERGGMLVPTAGEVEWNLPDGDLPYWRAETTEVDYDLGRTD